MNIEKLSYDLMGCIFDFIGISVYKVFPFSKKYKQEFADHMQKMMKYDNIQRNPNIIELSVFQCIWDEKLIRTHIPTTITGLVKYEENDIEELFENLIDDINPFCIINFSVRHSIKSNFQSTYLFQGKHILHALIKSIEYKNEEMFDYFLDMKPYTYYDDSNQKLIRNKIIDSDSFYFIKILYDLGYDFKMLEYCHILKSCNILLIEWVIELEKFKNTPIISFLELKKYDSTEDVVIYCVVEEDNKNVLEWLIHEKKYSIDAIGKEIIKNGSLELLKYIISTGYLWDEKSIQCEIIVSNNTEKFEWVSTDKIFESLNWEKFFEKSPGIPEFVLKVNNFEMLKMILLMDCPSSSQICLNAIANKNTEMLKFCLKIHKPNIKMFLDAFRNYSYEIVETLTENTEDIDSITDDDSINKGISPILARLISLKDIMMLTTFKFMKKDKSYFNRIIDNNPCGQKEKNNIFKWMIDNGFVIDNSVFRRLVEINNFELFNKLMKRIDEGLIEDIDKDIDIYTTAHAYNYSYETIKKIISHGFVVNSAFCDIIYKNNWIELLDQVIICKCRIDSGVFRYGALNECFDLLDWAQANNCVWDDDCYRIAFGKNYGVINWMIKNKIPISNEILIKFLEVIDKELFSQLVKSNILVINKDSNSIKDIVATNTETYSTLDDTDNLFGHGYSDY
jgi:hypothetical protein